MRVFTYSEARQNFSRILDMADSAGKVLIRRKNGKTYSLTSRQKESSPLDVPSINAKISTKEIVDILRKGRERNSV